MKSNYLISLLFLIGSLIAFAVIAAIVYFYFNSPNVDTENWGSPAEFGQFGDMIGGIINPIFGFLTVIFLVLTLQIEIRQSHRGKKLSDRAELMNILTSSKLEFKNAVENEIIINGKGEKQSLANVRLYRNRFETEIDQTNRVLAYLKENGHPSLKEIVAFNTSHNIESTTFFAVQTSFNSMKEVIQIFLDLIDEDFSVVSNKHYIRQLNDFLVPIYHQTKLVTHRECIDHLKEACRKANLSFKSLPLTFYDAS